MLHVRRKRLGSGDCGVAYYYVGRGVLKYTRSTSEYEVAQKLTNSNYVHLLNVYDTLETKEGFYVVYKPYCVPLSAEERELLIDYTNEVKKSGSHFLLNEGTFLSKQLYNLYVELQYLNLRYGGDVHADNLGYYCGNLVHYDVEDYCSEKKYEKVKVKVKK